MKHTRIRILALIATCCAFAVAAMAAGSTTPAKKGGKKNSKTATTTSAASKAPVPLFDPGPSPTMGRKAPDTATILFDGTNMDAWAYHDPNNWLKPDGPVDWPIKDGIVTNIATKDTENHRSIITKEQYGDFKFHAEVATTETPTNAGFYLHSHYELKLLETYGNPTPPSTGNFGNCDAGGTPKVNVSRPKEEWQTYDVEFHAPKFDADGNKIANARATVVVNGVKLYDNQELSNLRLAAAKIPENPRAPLQIKEHGNIVHYRNLWIIDMEKHPDYKTIIDGMSIADAIAKAKEQASHAQ